MSGLVWITGASSGLGRATALRHALGGWRVAASARGETALGQLAAETTGTTGAILPFPCDIGDRQAVAATLSAIEAVHGPVERAILNAGTHRPFDAVRFDGAVFRELVEINLMGTVHCLEALVPAMAARGRGQIAIVSSVAGYRGLPTAAAYGATKSALINMAEALHLELRGSGIDVRLICPGFIRTPLTDRNPFPMPFLMEADLAADR
ncbi:MAG: SDR family NAD(P)-dependent oxidoreductase, partial [Alphaproteobacteria bacterium]|nr:SDR family NAD(P)-dependent oxidoreductase [Alphaproteobacteria bacterium]